MHFYFSRSGNFNSIWQLLHFPDNPVTVSGYGQGWGAGVPKARLWSLAEIGWKCCHVGAPWSASTEHR